jgi:hypothetical protein
MGHPRSETELQPHKCDAWLLNPIKGIVSRDFVTLFISLDRFEGGIRAGSGLFFILITFSCFNFEKIMHRR